MIFQRVNLVLALSMNFHIEAQESKISLASICCEIRTIFAQSNPVLYHDQFEYRDPAIPKKAVRSPRAVRVFPTPPTYRGATPVSRQVSTQPRIAALTVKITSSAPFAALLGVCRATFRTILSKSSRSRLVRSCEPGLWSAHDSVRPKPKTRAIFSSGIRPPASFTSKYHRTDQPRSSPSFGLARPSTCTPSLPFVIN